MSGFSQSKRDFDENLGTSDYLDESLVPVNGKIQRNIPIRNAKGELLEEYYKWQFIYALLEGELYKRGFIGAEVHFPKGSISAADLEIDAAIFDSEDWISHYNDYRTTKKADDLQWLNDHLLAVVEFKRDDKDIERVFVGQVKPAMREKEPSDAYVLGIYYDHGRLLLFHRRDGRYLRYDEAKNLKGVKSGTADLSLHLPDPYSSIPSFNQLRARVNIPAGVDRTARGIDDLDVIPSITTVQMTDSLSNVLRVLDRVHLMNQRGYEILIQCFALKIFDEKRNQKAGRTLDFYQLDDERNKNLKSEGLQSFIKRIRALRDDASAQYPAILARSVIDWKDAADVQVVCAVVENFQDFSFVRSSGTDLYQLVFYNFANKFQGNEQGQFLTPLAVIEFLVKLVNPRHDESVFDPCCGIGDFLSLAFVNSKLAGTQLDDANIYGADISGDMIALASLNMLLNGDGEAHLFQLPDPGSILYKISDGKPSVPVPLIPKRHRDGNWDDWPDKTRLKKFDVILTNPPFGRDRGLRPEGSEEKRIAEMYQTWLLTSRDAFLDRGIVFLENAVRSLKEGGRLGIVVSNSIASVDRWEKQREWLMANVRIVATFDLPPNVFAETGVNTTLIVAYKPSADTLEELIRSNYAIFVRIIESVGYEKRTVKRNVIFYPLYRFDDETFDIATDEDGHPIRKEDFTECLDDFREWALDQEPALGMAFLGKE